MKRFLSKKPILIGAAVLLFALLLWQVNAGRPRTYVLQRSETPIGFDAQNRLYCFDTRRQSALDYSGQSVMVRDVFGHRSEMEIPDYGYRSEKLVFSRDGRFSLYSASSVTATRLDGDGGPQAFALPAGSASVVQADSLGNGDIQVLAGSLRSNEFAGTGVLFVHRYRVGQTRPLATYRLASFDAKLKAPRLGLFSPDGKLVMVRWYDVLRSGKQPYLSPVVGAQMWDVEAGRVLSDWKMGQWVQGLTFSPDGTLVAGLQSGSSVQGYLWNAKTGKLQMMFSGLQTPPAKPKTLLPQFMVPIFGRFFPTRPAVGRPYSVDQFAFTFSPDSRTIYAARDDGKIIAFNVQSGLAKKLIGEVPTCVRNLQCSPDGKTLAALSLGEWGGAATLTQLSVN